MFCVHVMAHVIFFRYSPVNNALFPRADTLSTNETHEKESFDDWYIIIQLKNLLGTCISGVFKECF